MNIKEIEVFLTIIKVGNISKAAEVLFSSQSAISTSLIRLEEELGFPLIERSKGVKTIAVTQKGKEFLPIAMKWVEANLQTQHFRKNPRCHHLSIGTVDTLLSCTFADFFKGMISEKNENTYSICVFNSDEIYTYVENSRLDIGLVFQYSPERNVVIEPILSEPMYLVMAHCHKAIYALSELDINKEAIIVWNKAFDDWHKAYFSEADNAKLHISTLPLMVHALKEMESWAIVPSSIATFLCQKHGFEMAELSVAPPRREIFLIKKYNPSPESIDNIFGFEEEMKQFVKQYF